jgi:hypothetical protein
MKRTCNDFSATWSHAKWKYISTCMFCSCVEHGIKWEVWRLYDHTKVSVEKRAKIPRSRKRAWIQKSSTAIYICNWFVLYFGAWPRYSRLLSRAPWDKIQTRKYIINTSGSSTSPANLCLRRASSVEKIVRIISNP